VILTLAWQHGHLIAVAACLALVCTVAVAWCTLCLRSRLRTAPQPFADTLAEFKRDE
jgi:hypothetical protein